MDHRMHAQDTENHALNKRTHLLDKGMTQCSGLSIHAPGMVWIGVGGGRGVHAIVASLKGQALESRQAPEK